MVKDIKGYEGYYTISYDCVITNVKTGHILKYRDDCRGYLCVVLSKDGVSRTHKVHRLMAEAFVPNPNPQKYNIVMHKDNNRYNNHPSNLEWGTSAMNNIQAYRDGSRDLSVMPGVKKHYVFKHPDGTDANPMYYTGIRPVVDYMGYGTVNTAYSLLTHQSKISQNAYKGCHIERFNPTI